MGTGGRETGTGPQTIRERRQRILPVLLLVLAAALFGTVGISTRALYGLVATNAPSVGFLRLALGAPVLVALALLLHLRSPANVSPQRRYLARDLIIFLIASMGVAGYQVCYMSAVGRIGVTATTLLAICTSPVVIALLAIAVLGERLTRTILVALVLATAGAALLVGPIDNNAVPDMIGGAILALGASLSYSAYAIAAKRLVATWPPLMIMAIAFSAGALLLLPALPLLSPGGLMLDYPPQGWLLLLYLGAITTGAAYTCYILGLRHTPATIAGIAGLLEPLTAAILARLLFNEALGQTALLGAALLLVAIVVLAIWSGQGRT